MFRGDLVIVFLGILTLSLCSLTVVTWLTAFELRRMFRRLDSTLGHIDRVIGTAQGTFAHARKVAARANGLTQHVEGIIRRACTVVEDGLVEVESLKDRAKAMLAHRFGSGNGMRAEPHSRSRKPWNRRRDRG